MNVATPHTCARCHGSAGAPPRPPTVTAAVSVGCRWPPVTLLSCTPCPQMLEKPSPPLEAAHSQLMDMGVQKAGSAAPGRGNCDGILSPDPTGGFGWAGRAPFSLLLCPASLTASQLSPASAPTSIVYTRIFLLLGNPRKIVEAVKSSSPQSLRASAR